MDSTEVIFPEWRNGNSSIKYPFTDTATLVNVDGITIDPDLFDDARVYPVGGSPGMYLSSVVVTALGLFFHVSDPVAGELASGGFLFADATPREIALFDQYNRPAGILVSTVAKLDQARGHYPLGTTAFTQAQAEFAPTVAVPIPNTGLRGVLLDDGGFLSGEIFLVGSNGIVLSVVDGQIRVDIIGDPYALVNACAKEGFLTPPFCGLKTINGIPPNNRGDWKFTVGGNLSQTTIIRISQDDSGNVGLQALGAPA